MSLNQVPCIARRVQRPATAIIIGGGILLAFVFPLVDTGPWLSTPGSFFHALDYDRFPGLSTVREHVMAGDVNTAKIALHEYFVTRDLRPLYPHAGNTGYQQAADKVINREFTVQGKTYVLNTTGNRTVNGRTVINMNFHENPDVDGDNEWIWLLNRAGSWLGPLSRTARGFLDIIDTTTGEYYAEALVDLFTMFVDDEPVGSAFSWRTIDSAIRVGNLIPAFDAIRDSNAFTPDACFLYLSSLLDHGMLLYLYHKTRTNWAWIEANYLVMLAAYFPEFKASRAWITECWGLLDRLVQESVYPDGGTNEQSIEYHMVMLRNLLDILEHDSGYEHVSAPGSLINIATKMAVFLIHNTMPDGYCTTYGHADLRETRWRIGKAARVLPGHPELDYFDHSGAPIPSRPPPRLNAGFRDTGIFISRSAWNDTNALYSFFDGSPFGFGYHQNDDVLNMMVSGFGRRLVIDPGRYSYLTDPVSMYLRSAYAHNTILINGKGLLGVSALGNEWAAGNLGSSARAWHGGFGAITERELTFVNFRSRPSTLPGNTSTLSDPARYWLASDFWHGSGHNEAWVHWQLPYHEPVFIDNASNSVGATPGTGIHCMTTSFASGNLAMFGFGPWDRVEHVSEGDPAIHGQPYGYWSPDYNVLEPATTYRFMGTTSGPSSWFTVLYPYDTSVNLSVNAIPYRIGLASHGVDDHVKPANILSVVLPDGSMDIHVTRRRGFNPDASVSFSFAGHAYEVRGDQVSLHIPAGSSLPSQLLARHVSRLVVDGFAWVQVQDNTVALKGGVFDHVSIGIDGATTTTVLVNGNAVDASRLLFEEGSVNVHLMV